MAVGTQQGQVNQYDRVDLRLPTAEVVPLNALIQAQAARRTTAPANGESISDRIDLGDGFWYRHNQEMQDRMNRVFNMGAEIQSAGEDPFTGTSQISQLFQKEAAELENFAKMSQQMRTDWNTGMELINSQDEETRIADESKAAWMSFFDQGLEDAVKSGQAPPPLLLANPEFSLNAWYGEWNKGIAASDKTSFSNNDISQFAQDALTDAQFQRAIVSQINNMDASAREVLEGQARNMNIRPEQLLAQQQMRSRLMNTSDTYDFEAIEKMMTPNLTQSMIERGDVTIGWSGWATNDIEDLVHLVVEANPQYVSEGVASGRFGDPRASFQENKQAAIEFGIALKKAQAPSSVTRSEDEPPGGRGFSNEEVLMARNQWLTDIRSSDRNKRLEAAGYLVGTDLPNGYTIMRVEKPVTLMDGTVIKPDETYMAVVTQKVPYVFTLVEGGVDLDKENNLTQEDVRPIDLFFDEQPNESLLSYYDKSASSSKERMPYGVSRMNNLNETILMPDGTRRPANEPEIFDPTQ